MIIAFILVVSDSNVKNRSEGIKTGKQETHWRHNQGKKT